MVESVIIILYLVACVGMGVLLGWFIWGNNVKYYKDLYEYYKTKYNSPEEKKARFQKQVKDALDKYMEKRLKSLEENKQKFKKGDFLKDEFGNIFICNDAYNTCWENDYLGTAFCVLFNDMTFSGKDWIWRSCLVSYATEEEKERLLKAINENGYMWDDKKLDLIKMQR